MPSIEFSDAELGYGSAASILEHLTLRIEPGWLGVVGANGHGKSTLLSAIAGAPLVRRGRLVVDAQVIAVCPQRLTLNEAMHELAGRDDRDAVRMRSLFDLVDLARWSTMSPGEARRWQLAAAIAKHPDVLLVDEPTNHLDADGRAHVVRLLDRFRGIGVLVSHDRALLEALTSQTLWLQSGEATLYAGSYGAARAQREDAKTTARREREHLQQRITRSERQLHRANERARLATADKSTGRRMRNRHDSDARTLGAQTLVEWGQASMQRAAGVKRRELEKLEAELAPGVKDTTIGALIAFEHEVAPKRIVAHLEVPSLVLGGRELLCDVRLSLMRNEHVRLSGCNGAGKSTLARRVVETSTLPSERLLYVPQELPDAAEALEQLRVLPPRERGEVLELVAALGCDPDVLLATPEPSPGEARKLAIARGLQQRPWLVVLDEPTNHLDLATAEKLGAALSNYPGALLLITHDDALAVECTSVNWQITDGKVRVT